MSAAAESIEMKVKLRFHFCIFAPKMDLDRFLQRAPIRWNLIHYAGINCGKSNVEESSVWKTFISMFHDQPTDIPK
jgi:hypothetical protein